MYTEFISKSNEHKFKDTNISNKQVHSYNFAGNGRCLVKLLVFYLSKLPPNLSNLYMHSLPVQLFQMSQASHSIAIY